MTLPHWSLSQLWLEVDRHSALVPCLWNSLCTQWELHKYLMRALHLGSQQLLPARTLSPTGQIRWGDPAGL